MHSPLRKLIVASAVIAATAFTTGTAMAQRTVKVPFDFIAAGRVCTAGTYSLARNSVSNTVMLKSATGSCGMIWSIDQPASGADQTALRFDDVNGHHLLASIQYGRMTTDRLDKHAAAELAKAHREPAPGILACSE